MRWSFVTDAAAGFESRVDWNEMRMVAEKFNPVSYVELSCSCVVQTTNTAEKK